MLITLGEHRFSLLHVIGFDRVGLTIHLVDSHKIVLSVDQAVAFAEFWDKESHKPATRIDTTTSIPDDEERRTFELG
jgi:hypothetical protein